MKKILILSMLFCACSAEAGDLPTEDVQYAKGDAIIGPIIMPSQDILTLEETDADISDDVTKKSLD
tara:strand:- start:5874 stop:6071 length:198 start_codon:yes stop_codon:yes gene_type:complete